MVVAMRIVKAENTPVVSAMNGVIDVRQVVASDDGLSAFLISPDLIAQQTPQTLACSGVIDFAQECFA